MSNRSFHAEKSILNLKWNLGLKGACDSSGPFCILGTRILNYRRNVCRYFVVDTRGIDSIRVYGSRRSIDIGTLLRENKQREISRARSNRISLKLLRGHSSSLTLTFLVPEYDVKSIETSLCILFSMFCLYFCTSLSLYSYIF